MASASALSEVSLSVGDELAPSAPSVAEASRFDCPACMQLLLRPVRLACGHHVCAGCLNITVGARYGSMAVGRPLRSCPRCNARVPQHAVYEEDLSLSAQIASERPQQLQLRKSTAALYEALRASPGRRPFRLRAEGRTLFALRLGCMGFALAQVIVAVSADVRGTCDDARLVAPNSWLLWNGVLSLARLSMALLAKRCAEPRERARPIRRGDCERLLHLLDRAFMLAWAVCGAVALWRDNPACAPALFYNVFCGAVVLHFVRLAAEWMLGVLHDGTDDD